MTKYAAFSHSDIPFLNQAFVPDDMPLRSLEHFVRVDDLYVPEESLKESLRQDTPTARPANWRLLLDILRESHFFLPLDGTSAACAAQWGVRFKLPADLLTPDEFYTASGEGNDKFLAWLDKADARNLGWSENWFAHDGQSFHFMFRAAHLAAGLAPVFAKEAEELICIGRTPPSLYPVFSHNGLAQSIWSKALPGLVRQYRYSADPQQDPPPLEGCDKQDYGAMEDAFVFCLFEGLLYRHRHLLNAVRKQSQRRLVLALTEDTPARPYSSPILQGQLNIPGYHALVMPAPSGAAQRFSPTVVRLLRQSIEEYFPQTQDADVFFTEIAASRLYTVERMYSNITELWRKYPPTLCVGENTLIGEYSVPLVAARALNIPGVSLPHATLDWPHLKRGVPAVSRLCSTPAEVGAWNQARENKEEVVCFAEVDMEASYIHTPQAAFRLPRHRQIMLVILGVPLLVTMPMTYNLHPPALQTWLTVFNKVPEALRSTMHVIYKLHPGAGECIIMASSGIPSENVVPNDTPLRDILPHVNLVVSCEYISSPSIVAMKRSIPVIHCLEEVALKSFFYSPALRSVAKSGKLLHSPDDFWPYASSVLTDGPERAAHVSRQHEFLQRHIQPTSRGVASYLEQVVHRHKQTTKSDNGIEIV